MIGYLRGTARTSRIVDVGGVGYVVACPAPLTPGQDVELHIYTQVREDAISLYGFVEEAERSLFEALVKVTGVGPSIALALLAGLGTREVIDAIGRKDVKTLSSVKGVGGKVAEKIVTLCQVPEGVGEDPRVTEIVAALTGLGFERAIAREAARWAIEDADTGTSEAQLITNAIAAAKRGGA